MQPLLWDDSSLFAQRLIDPSRAIALVLVNVRQPDTRCPVLFDNTLSVQTKKKQRRLYGGLVRYRTATATRPKDVGHNLQMVRYRVRARLTAPTTPRAYEAVRNYYTRYVTNFPTTDRRFHAFCVLANNGFCQGVGSRRGITLSLPRIIALTTCRISSFTEGSHTCYDTGARCVCSEAPNLLRSCIPFLTQNTDFE